MENRNILWLLLLFLLTVLLFFYLNALNPNDLNLSFDAEMFDYEEIKQRMLKLFPERKKVN